MMLKKVTTLRINCMLFLTVLMSSLMVCKLWKMANILFVHPVKAVLSYTRGRISTIIVTEFKEFQDLLIVFSKLIKILYFQDQKTVLWEVLDLNLIKLSKQSDSMNKTITSQLNPYHFPIVETLSLQRVMTTRSNFMTSVNS